MSVFLPLFALFFFSPSFLFSDFKKYINVVIITTFTKVCPSLARLVHKIAFCGFDLDTHQAVASMCVFMCLSYA